MPWPRTSNSPVSGHLMQIERLTVESPSEPFPIYAYPIGDFLRAHVGDMVDRDAAVAHVLAVLSGYAYSDTATSP